MLFYLIMHFSPAVISSEKWLKYSRYGLKQQMISIMNRKQVCGIILHIDKEVNIFILASRVNVNLPGTIKDTWSIHLELLIFKVSFHGS